MKPINSFFKVSKSKRNSTVLSFSNLTIDNFVSVSKSKKTENTNNNNFDTLSNDCNYTVNNEKSNLEIAKKLKANYIEGAEGMSPEWKNILSSEFNKPYFKKLGAFVTNERKTKIIYPPFETVHSWSNFCKVCDIKVVIIGQDPYHGPNQAHGLSFSVNTNVAIPASLRNIYKELSTDITNFKIPNHGNLRGWAKQGVLMLNSCLTVEQAKPNSHKNKGWEILTDAIISYINLNLKNVVFLLWGANAKEKGSKIDTNEHLVLDTVHPSPLSANRGFFGCKHFSKTNKYLIKHGKNAIDWNNLIP